MSKIFDFIKKNWLVIGMGIVIVYLFLRNNIGVSQSVMPMTEREIGMDYADSGVAMKSVSNSSINGLVNQPAPTEQADRMVVQDTSVSMLVKDVAVTLKGIEKQAVEAGGYMVNKSLSKPEGAANGFISLRVPIEKRETTLDVIRALGVKVVSENVKGHDVTDQYVDLEGRITSLNRTKVKMEAIMDQATKVSDLVDVQRQLTNIEQQIDSYKGQQKYLEQTAKLTLISVNMSTDELSLPYAPDKAWRPEAVFKSAVRSMVGTLRGVGSLVIWLVVYAPIWALAIGVILLFKKIIARKAV